MNSFKCIYLVFLNFVLIKNSLGIRNLDNLVPSGRQSKAISFFPTEEKQQSNFIENKQQSALNFNQNYNQNANFRFSDNQREINQNNYLNHNEIPDGNLQTQKQQYQQNGFFQQKYRDPVDPYAQKYQNYYQRPYYQQPFSVRPQAIYNNQYFNRPQPQQQFQSFPQQRPHHQFQQQQQQYQQQQPQINPYYDQNYASQFNHNPQGGYPSDGQSLNPLSNLFGNFQQGQFGNVGGQLSKALEDISRFDDHQCVPKLLCQMIGNPRGQSSLPGFLSAPSLTALIAALPSSSPFLNFGRAALLGASGGERGCDGAYPKCPRNEDDLLYYLNNHRGGFFRFFNGGSAFGDEGDYDQDYQQDGQNHNQQNYNQQNYNQQNYNQQNYQQNYQDPQNAQATLTNLQNLAETINQGGGINLSNLGSNIGLLSNLANLAGTLNQGNSGGNSGSQSQSSNGGVGEFVGNLLTGLVGNRFSGRTHSRKINKRSVENLNENTKNELENLLLSIHKTEKRKKSKKRRSSRKRNLNVELVNPFETYERKKEVEKNPIDYKILELIRLSEENLLEPRSYEILPEDVVFKKRILNVNQPQIPIFGSNSIATFFPNDIASVNYKKTRDEKQLNPSEFFPQTNKYQSSEKFPVSYQNFFRFPINDEGGNRSPKLINFVTSHQPVRLDPLDNDYPKPLEYYDRTKMIFPDRTGTGNLRFDNNQFSVETGTRFGKILTGTNQQNYQSNLGSNSNNNNNQNSQNDGNYQYYHQFSFAQPSTTVNRYPQNNHQNYNSNRRPVQNYYRPPPKKQHEDTSQNIYVTDSKGVIEYYINAKGEKIYT